MIKLFRKYFSTNILFLSYTFTSVLIGFLLRLLTMGNVNDFRAYVCDFIVVIVVGSFGYLIKPKNQFKYFLSVSILFTAMCVVNSIYYKFFHFFSFLHLSLHELSYFIYPIIFIFYSKYSLLSIVLFTNFKNLSNIYNCLISFFQYIFSYIYYFICCC